MRKPTIRAAKMRLLCTDCDGTIREPLSGNTFIQHPRDQVIISGVNEVLQELFSQGGTIIGVTNQGGVAAGHKTLEQAIEEQKYTLLLCSAIHSVLFCPDFDGEFCYQVERSNVIKQYRRSENPERYESFRKPGGGMLKLAKDMFPIDPTECWYVGDRQEDADAAKSADFTFFDAITSVSHKLSLARQVSAQLQTLEILPARLENLHLRL